MCSTNTKYGFKLIFLCTANHNDFVKQCIFQSQLKNFNFKKYVSVWYNFFQYIATLHYIYIGIGLDFFLKKANSKGARIFLRSLFFVYWMSPKK